MSEDDLLTAVLDLAKLGGWLVYHVRNSRAGVIQGSGEGFPDLVMVKGERIIFRELKRQSGHLTPAQDVWAQRLIAAGQDWDVWRPSDWYAIESTLRGPVRPPG